MHTLSDTRLLRCYCAVCHGRELHQSGYLRDVRIVQCLNCGGEVNDKPEGSSKAKAIAPRKAKETRTKNKE